MYLLQRRFITAILVPRDYSDTIKSYHAVTATVSDPIAIQYITQYKAHHPDTTQQNQTLTEKVQKPSLSFKQNLGNYIQSIEPPQIVGARNNPVHANV